MFVMVSSAMFPFQFHGFIDEIILKIKGRQIMVQLIVENLVQDHILIKQVKTVQIGFISSSRPGQVSMPVEISHKDPSSALPTLKRGRGQER